MNVTERLQAIVTEQAELAGVPGVSVGVWLDGDASYAYHGVTSIENPLPVDENTLFQFGSTGKTFTGTAIMRLVQDGRIDLDAPVRQYLPDFRVSDEAASAAVTVLQLLNHTAGWSGDRMGDASDNGPESIERFVAAMAGLEQEFAPGTAMSYNNASLSVAGRIIEVVTGQRFEQAIQELVLTPLGLEHTFTSGDDAMTRRFAVGHVPAGEDALAVARPWGLPRSGAPAGGLTANAGDLVSWIRFHLGDGTAADGSRVLEEATLKRMQQPTVDIEGSALGDHIGISWMLADVDGVRLVSHGGNTIGQESAFVMVPERSFGIATLTNASGPGGSFNTAVVKAALAEFAGVQEVEPEPTDRTDAELSGYAGQYETVAMAIDISVDGHRLSADMKAKPAFLEALGASEEDFAQPPVALGMVGADGDRFIAVDGSSKGMKGVFFRSPDGAVTGAHIGGRFAARINVPAGRG
ncbi:serine hydrolase domain-containing protein [Nakamurella lactea]|uniref:serine hydrolase domain-containing protein n=1 Tax=Nakamurella lactea TaxID=459515 RepID=UPI00040F8848|nr:serine hydrolase domain-containing protein [Nakamurella lactea]